MGSVAKLLVTSRFSENARVSNGVTDAGHPATAVGRETGGRKGVGGEEAEEPEAEASKEEAQAEIEKYKKEREQQFGEHEAKFVGSKDDVMKKINADTQAKVEQMNRSVEANKQAVIDNLIGVTCDIKSQVHVNFRG